MKIKAFSTLGEISHFAISGYFVISGFDITGVDYINYSFEYQPMDPRRPLNIYFCIWTPSLMLWTPKGPWTQVGNHCPKMCTNVILYD